MNNLTELKITCLSNIVEDSLFDVKKLKELKKKLHRLPLQEEEISRIIKQIVKYLAEAYDSLEKRLPFYIENYWKSKDLSEFADNAEKPQEINLSTGSLEKKIRERDELLLSLKKRITEIYKKL